MSDLPTYEDEDDILAGEYVLGVLEEDAFEAARARLETDPVFADRVAFWEAQFDGFNEEYNSITPPRRVKTDLEARLFGTPKRWWQRRVVWFGSGLVAASLALTLVFTPLSEQTSPPDFRADLTAEGSALAFAATFDADYGLLNVAGVATDQLPSGNSYELWVIPEGASPISLGVVTATTTRVLDAEITSLMIAGATLAVTQEIFGGSPTGAPQGPVVVIGALKTL